MPVMTLSAARSLFNESWLLLAGLVLVFAAVPPRPAAAVEVSVLVEHAKGVEDIDALDFLAPGELVDLGESGELTLTYLSSCRHERIQGGIVIIGETNSTASGGVIDVSIVPCKAQKIDQTADTRTLTVLRPFQETRNILSPQPDVIVFSVFPVLKSLAKVGSVKLVRLDRDEPERELRLKNGVGDFHSLRLRLEPNGLYKIINGETDTIFQVDSDAATDTKAILSRLVVI